MAILGQCTEMLAADDVIVRCPAKAVGRYERSSKSRGGVLAERYLQHPMCAYHASTTAVAKPGAAIPTEDAIREAKDMGLRELRYEVEKLIEELKELRRKLT